MSRSGQITKQKDKVLFYFLLKILTSEISMRVSQSEPLGFYFVFVRSGSAFISSTSIYADSVMDVSRGSSELPKGAELNKK